MRRSPTERNFPSGLAALAAAAIAALVVHVASAPTGAGSAAADHGAAGVEAQAVPPLPALAPTIDPAALATNAMAAGDAQTVEASIAAYER